MPGTSARSPWYHLVRAGQAFVGPVAPAWSRYGIALAGVGILTAILAVPGRSVLASASMLYIIAVLLTAVVLGRGPAILAALAAFLGSNFFLVEPRLSFSVADPNEWVTLLLLLVTAVLTGQLAASQRMRADEAAQAERQARILFDMAVLLGEQALPRALEAVAERLREELGAAAVRIDLLSRVGGTFATAAVGDLEAREALKDARVGGSGRVLTAPRPSQDGDHHETGRWIRVSVPQRLGKGKGSLSLLRVPIQSPEAGRGEISLAARSTDELGPGASRLLSAVAVQLAPAMDRARLREEATEAEVLRRTDDAKSALLHAVSHDLRTPLASIIASAGSLRQTDVAWSDDQRRGFAETIEQEAERLNRIVGNLLDLSRIQAGTLRPDRAWVDPSTIIRDVVGRLQATVVGHALVLDVPDELEPVFVDWSEIDQVLSNLVENAARHSPAGGEVRIRGRVEGGELSVSVEDDGPGLAGVDLARLFEPFYRPPHARSTGIGLGLAVARGLVAAHGGRIWAESAPSGGARFVFTIPAPAE